MPTLPPAAARFVLLARLLGATAGRNALRSSVSLYLTVGIGAFVIFAGNGLDARTVTTLATTRPSFGFALTMIWVLAALPAAKALLWSTETHFLRALPIARSEIVALLGAALVVAHVPWIALWGRGAGTGAALRAALIALALEVQILAGVRSARDAAAFSCAAAAVFLGPSHPAAFVAGPAFVLGMREAFVRAPEPRSVGRYAICTASRACALASALWVSVYRGHAPVVARALLLALAAAAVVPLGLRNNEIENAETIRRVSLMVWGPACVFGAVGIAGPLWRAEDNARWVFDLYGVPAWLRSASAAGLLGAAAAVVGALYGALIGEALALTLGLRAVLAIENAAAAAAWAALVTSIVRITRPSSAWKGSRPSEGRAVLRLLLMVSGVCVGSAALLMASPAIAAGVLLVSAGALVAVAARVPNRR